MSKRRRRRGEGSVFFDRTARVWVARVSLGVVDGRRIGRKATARTEQGARHELERLLRAYSSDTDAATGTLDSYLEGWLEGHRSVRASTLRSYRDHVRDHISPLLGGIPVAKLRPGDVERLIADRLRTKSHRGRPLSPATVVRIVATLRAALGEGVRRGELAANVAGQVRLPRVDREPVAAMSIKGADQLLEAVAGHWSEPVVRLLLGSALRLGEAVSLNQGDVFPDQAFVRIRRSKTTIRAVPVSDDAVDAIRMALASAPRRGDDEPLFFGQRSGDRLRGDTLSTALPRLLAAAGLPRLSPHGLRHGAATLMVAGGVHMRIVAEQLGHRNPALTARIYAHVVPEVQREAVRALPARRRG